MVSFSNAITDFMRNNLCAALGVLGPAVTLAQDLSPIDFPPVNVPNALSMLLCDQPPDRLPPPDPPFTGGQCNEKYIVDYTLDSANPGSTSGTLLTLGPIRGLRQETQSNGSVRVFIQSNSNVVFSGLCFNFVSGNSPQETFIGSFTPTGGSMATINSVTPCGADDCGDPDPVYPPPDVTYEFGDDITYNIDESTEITIPVTAVFAPIFLDFDGSLRIPVTFNAGGINFNGELTVAPEFKFDFFPTTITVGPGRPDDDDPSGGQPQVEVPEDEESAPVIVGVLVYSQFDGENNGATGLISTGGPTLLVPRIGSVQFAIKTGNSIGWTSDLDVKNLECYVPCPAPQGAIAVRVTPAPGFTRTFTPVRGRPLTAFSQ